MHEIRIEIRHHDQLQLINYVCMYTRGAASRDIRQSIGWRREKGGCNIIITSEKDGNEDITLEYYRYLHIDPIRSLLQLILYTSA